MTTSNLFRLLGLSGLFLLTSAFSNLRTCLDGNCGRSNRTIDMRNDFGNTTCKPLSVVMGGSFQITELDPGCTVTLYGASSNGRTCPSDTQATCRVGTCYSSSWMYYSIQGCRPATVSAASSSIPSSSATGQTLDSQTRRDGVIAGSLVAGVSGATLVFIGVVVVLRRHRSQANKPGRAHELPDDRGLVETLSIEKQIPKELWADHVAVEIGRNSKVEPPIDYCSLMKRSTTEGQPEPPPVITIHLAE
ncbi:hypothetical protein FB567DRAFT_551925 [Paraphoma chrysanthemicola]|uniref:Uncharacterized protein n=1 Tax=Paraphoma chrysanthemicola TaxID=798071 RepID=A0A8K0R180_9PLEO|nr:hypothetical protein FB567DRAFT_551925 [Paraphoma chrysanthemicola]